MSALNRKGASSPKKRQKSAVSEKKIAQPAPEKTRKQTAESPPKRPSRKQAGARFAPTDDQRTIVNLAVAIGYTEAQVCRLVLNPETLEPISPTTLRKHFAEELATGRDKAILKVAGSLFGTATDRAHKGHVPAAIYFLKTQGQWREPEPEWARQRKAQAELEAQVGNERIVFTLKLEDDLPPEPESNG